MISYGKMKENQYHCHDDTGIYPTVLISFFDSFPSTLKPMPHPDRYVVDLSGHHAAHSLAPHTRIERGTSDQGFYY